MSPGPSEREPWALGDLVWLTVPVLAVLAVAAYFVGGILLGAIPPFTVVDGQSMRPTYQPGDLLVVRGVAAGDIEVGDILSVMPPASQVEDNGLPGEIVHRVVRIQYPDDGMKIITQGDNNPEEDSFVSHPTSVRGEIVGRVPGLGYPVLFFRSEQGRIFLAAIGLAIIGYFVVAAIERRQEAAELESPRDALERLTAEIRQLGGLVAGSGAPARTGELEVLALESHEVRETMGDLVGAVSEYGHHLRSHTAILQAMSQASQELSRVVEGLGAVVELGRTPGDVPFSAAPPTALAASAAELTPTVPHCSLEPYLFAWLRGNAYQEWSLLALQPVAHRLGHDNATIQSALVRLALADRIELRPVRASDLYRYRLS